MVFMVGILWLAAANAGAVGGPAAHWKLDETSGSIADDAVASSNGSIHGAASIVDGFDGRAFRFDGADDVTVPGAAHLRSADMVLSLWVRAGENSPPGTGQVLVDNGNVLCGGNGYALVRTATWAKLVFRDAQANIGVVTLQPPASIELPSLWDGNWHHVAIGAHGAQFGFVYLFIDGWHVATTSNQPSDLTDGIGYGASPTDPFVIGDDDQGCGPGFEGDIDDIRVYSHLIDRAELAGLEPEIETTLEIDSVEPGAVRTDANVSQWFDLDVTLQPAPAMPGSFWVHVTGDDGVEHTIQRFDISLGNLSADGRYDLAYFANYGGDSNIRVEYLPEIPALPSEDSEAVHIDKAETFTRFHFPEDHFAGQPLVIPVGVTSTARVQVTGSAELWDVTGDPVLLQTLTLLDGDGTWQGGVPFILAARPAGTYDFVAKYLGSSANDPSVSETVSVTVYPELPKGTTTIDAGAAYTRDTQVTVAVPIANPESYQWILLSNDGQIWTHVAYAPNVQWTLTPGAGTKTVWARWANLDNDASGAVADTIVLDPTAPTATTPGTGFAGGSSASGGNVPIRLSWSGSDATSGIARYELARSKDGGAWTTVTTSLTSPSSVRLLTPGHNYRFRVRPIDRAGNVGAWATGSSFKVSTAQEASSRITYRGTWKSGSPAGAWGGATRYATAAGASARITVTARAFAWVAPVGPTRGTARVYVNGTLVATIDLHAASTSSQRVAFAKSWAMPATRTIEVRVSGTAGHPRVDVDAFAWIP